MSASPNLLVILADQLRRDALAIYGDPNVETPHIDALAKRGVCFTRANSTSPICVPFRFSLMTGEYAHTRWVPGIEWCMSPAETTLADAFEAAGYRTAYIGKWHLSGGHGGAPWTSPRRVNRTPILRPYRGRWHVWRGFELRNDPFDTVYFADDDPTPIPLTGYQTDALTDLAIRTIDDLGRDRPFACILSVEPPHPPYDVPAEDLARWEGRDIPLPPNVPDALRADEALLDERRRYYAAVENLDRNVGRLCAHLERAELADDTVVVFLSDHGELAGSHGLRGKQYPFEPSVGIPLIVSDPRHAPHHGRTVDAPVSTEDLFPTLLGLVGRSARAGLPGADLAPAIRGEAPAPERPGVLLEFVLELRPGMPFFEGGWRGLRTERYKITWRRDEGGTRPWHLFDLDEDPHELRNLVDEAGTEELRAELNGTLEHLLRASEDPFVLDTTRPTAPLSGGTS